MIIKLIFLHIHLQSMTNQGQFPYVDFFVYDIQNIRKRTRRRHAED